MQVQKTIDTLQMVVTTLTAQANAHKVQGMIFEAQGFTKIGEKMKAHGTEEMGFANAFIERMLQLGGQVKIEAMPAMDVVTDVVAYLEADCKLSEGGIPQLRNIAASLQDDFVTFGLLKEYLADEEGDLHWMHQQKHLIEQLGRETWLSMQV